MGCGLWHHNQDARVVLGLELFDDLRSLVGCHAAVDGCSGVPSLDDPVLQHLQRVPVRHKHQHLLVGPCDHVKQFIDPVVHVELNHVSIVRVHSALRNLQQLVEHRRCVDGRDFGPGCDDRHLFFDCVIVLGLLRCQWHLACGVQHVRQVKALCFGKPYGWLQDLVHDALRVLARHPAVLRHLNHHAVAERAKELGHCVRVHQLGQTVRIKGRLRGRCAGHHPQPCAGPDQPCKALPAFSLHALDGVGLVHNDEIKAAVHQLLGHHLDAIEVDDDELVVLGNHGLPLLACALRDSHCAVHHRLEQVRAPRSLHDGHGAHDQHALDLALIHKVVGCPRCGAGLACASLVEHKAPGVER